MYINDHIYQIPISMYINVYIYQVYISMYINVHIAMYRDSKVKHSFQQNFINLQFLLYKDDLLENVVLPHLANIDTDTDYAVKQAAIKLLVNLAIECRSQKFTVILQIIKKVKVDILSIVLIAVY